MNQTRPIWVDGIPEQVPEVAASLCQNRLLIAVNKLLDETGLKEIKITIGTASEIDKNSENLSANTSDTNQKKSDNDLLPEERALKYKSGQPLFTFEQLVIPQEVEDELLLAVDLIELEAKVFDEWGLREIEPFPRTALNFYGPPGTGKTLAAHAISSKINRPILVASYAQIEVCITAKGQKMLRQFLSQPSERVPYYL